MNVRLVIRGNQPKNKAERKISIWYTHKSKTFMKSTGISIDPKHWDYDKEMIRKSFNGYVKLNAVLQDKKMQVLDITQTALLNNIDPSVDYVKRELNGKQVERVIPPLMEFIEAYIEESKTVKMKETIKTYNTAFKYLKEYQNYKRITLDYDDITLDFYFDYLRYMHSEKSLSVNGTSNKIKCLKAFMERAYDLNYHNNLSYKNKKFTTPKEESFHIYLNELEIKSMLNLDLSDNKRLERVRDLFCIACLTGLRYSDINNLKKQHIKDDFIKLKTIKGNQELVIPIHPEVRLIINRYKDEHNNFLLPKISNQKLNRYVKEIGLRAGIDEEIILTKKRGNKTTEEIVPKWKLITSHTGRRSMISNLILRGVDSNIIKKISGHTTDVFMKYVKISNQEAANTVAKIWSDSLSMRVA